MNYKSKERGSDISGNRYQNKYNYSRIYGLSTGIMFFHEGTV